MGSDLTPIFAFVSAVVRTMRRRVKELLNVPTGKDVVLNAGELRGVSERASLVAQDANVMPDCHSCKQDRVKGGLAARALYRLPSEITQSKEFKRKGLPISVCPYCDGKAFELALHTHKIRVDK